ncbi:hypothetical protein Airi02_019210 [Actinoallomurus iriomotensis]|uniref:Tn3 transposase DDE domain-containing protein n=1 Tax=Actinoallomurus iriomotensis TaxID=478107 RepID=A0A9W6VYS6_9ACTN|nr:hypothetical protein Airi02_019210 [Actinoallomurus iriomotensis]
MLPRVDLLEVILEGMSCEPSLLEAFTAVSGGRSRLEDLPISIAACLAAHSMNVGYRPIAKQGVPALERSRLSHVFQNLFRPETSLRRTRRWSPARPGSRWPARGAVGWSTGCGSWSPSQPRSPGPTVRSSDPVAA